MFLARGRDDVSISGSNLEGLERLEDFEMST